jgi:hypothetical protein
MINPHKPPCVSQRIRRCFGILLIATTCNLYADADNTGKQQIDASDPTQIVTFLGAGPKVTRYTDDANINEIRVSGTFGIGKKDMLIFETGYGHHTAEHESGLTNTQVRHFHLFKMDNEIKRGYRGWGSSIDLNLAGELKGMDGQNSLAIGASPAFALGGDWQLYPIVMLLNSWDKRFAHYNGGGVNFSPLLSKSFDWWDGSFISIWPQYNRFYWGELSGNGGGQLQLIVGGKFTDTFIWKVIGYEMFDKDFRAFKHDEGFPAKADRALHFRVESYF